MSIQDNLTVTTNGAEPSAWVVRLQRHGYYFRIAAIALIVIGVYIHVTRLLFGDDLLLRFVVTPNFDKALTVLMLYAAVTGLLGWSRVEFRNTMHKVAYGFVMFYICVGLPLHLRTFFTNSTDLLRAFPMWWSMVLMPIYAGSLWLLWRLHYRQ